MEPLGKWVEVESGFSEVFGVTFRKGGDFLLGFFVQRKEEEEESKGHGMDGLDGCCEN